MPCRSEWPTEEVPNEGAIVAGLLIWVCETLQRDPPIWAYDIANRAKLDNHRPTKALCKLLDKLSAEQRKYLFLPDHGEQAELLAEWWTEHQRYDEEERHKVTRRGKR